MLLRGTWRSDRARTEAQWVFPKRLALQRRRKFFAIFGHLELRFTAKRCFLKYRRTKGSCAYRIIWSREAHRPYFPQLVVIYERDEGEKAQHIFFDSENSFYVQGGRCEEYFRRVTPNNRWRGP